MKVTTGLELYNVHVTSVGFQGVADFRLFIFSLLARVEASNNLLLLPDSVKKESLLISH